MYEESEQLQLRSIHTLKQVFGSSHPKVSYVLSDLDHMA